MGFRRLSIIDLSASANQPLRSEDGEAAIVFNGEICNYREIRAHLIEEGFRFASHGDAEVVLNAWRRRGAESLGELHGMFGFALWEESTGGLFLARDRFGIKPLYYYESGGLFLFASEIKAILAHPAVSAAIDMESLQDYLTYGYVPEGRAIIAGVRKLPAAHYLVHREGETKVIRYWELAYRPRERSEGELVDGLREELRRAVSLWSVADVPVGLFLSGGLDSSSVCAMMRGEADAPVHTFSIGFDDPRRSELGYARIVAERFGTEHHELLVDAHDARAILPELARVYDEPFYDTSSVPLLYISRFARRHVKVVLAGDGGDELFFGYHWYREFLRNADAPFASSRAASALLRLLAPAARRIPGLARAVALERRVSPDPARRYFRLVGFFDDWEKARLLGRRAVAKGRDDLWLYRKHYHPELPAAAALRMLDIHTYLTDDILTKVDRATMACSLEARPPLLEHSLAEYVMTIPAERIAAGEGGKSVMKKGVENILPREILERGKKGFSAPVRHWMRGELESIVEERLLGGHAVRDGLFDPRAIRAMRATVATGRWAKTWMLLMFEGWYRRWIRGVEEPGLD